MAKSAVGQSWRFLAPSQMLAFGAMFIVLIAETGRIPVDNPATHLELTMIHEAMILEYSGPYLALIEWGASLKQLVLMTLLVNTFFPFGLSYGLDVIRASRPVWDITWLSCCDLLCHRSGRDANAKMRLFRVPELLAVAFVLGSAGADLNVPVLRRPCISFRTHNSATECITLMAAFVLVLQIAMVGQRWLITNIRIFAAQSFLLAGIANTIAYFNHAPHLYIAALLTLALKAALVPIVLERLVRKIDIAQEIAPLINVPLSLLISGGLTTVGYLVAQSFHRPEVSSFAGRSGPQYTGRGDFSVSDRILHDDQPA